MSFLVNKNKIKINKLEFELHREKATTIKSNSGKGRI